MTSWTHIDSFCCNKTTGPESKMSLKSHENHVQSEFLLQ